MPDKQSDKQSDLRSPAKSDPKADPKAGGKPGADKRQLILDAAIQVFAEKGFHATRISDIAREAEIAYGLVYHYFRNKEEILDTIFLDRWNLFIEAVQAITDDGRGVEQKLLSIAAVILSAYRNRPEWVQILVFEIQRSQRFTEPDRTQLVGRLFRLIAQILSDGQARGELRQDLDPTIACYVFVGSIDIVVTGRVLEMISTEEDDGAYYVRVARTIVDVFLNGMSA
jgi:AcrR family transcriptional regulator